MESKKLERSVAVTDVFAGSPLYAPNWYSFIHAAADFGLSYRDANVARLQLISDLCDLTVPSTALGYATFDDGIVGLAGTVSSLLGLLTVWKKTA